MPGSNEDIIIFFFAVHLLFLVEFCFEACAKKSNLLTGLNWASTSKLFQINNFFKKIRARYLTSTRMALKVVK